MSDNDVYLYYLPTESFDTSYSSSEEEMEVASTIQSYHGESHQTKISTQTDQNGFGRVRCSGRD